MVIPPGVKYGKKTLLCIYNACRQKIVQEVIKIFQNNREKFKTQCQSIS